MVYWGSPHMAHTMVSFGFEDGDHLCFSIETRKEKGEGYSAVKGLFRQFELIYIAADERDVVGWRTNYRKGEEAYLFRLAGSPEKVRAFFLNYVGLASAGYASRADDASTLFKNPAGMSRLEGAQFQGGLQALYGSVEFSPNANTSARLGSDDGGNAVGWLPGGGFFVTVPVNDKWQLGLGSCSYFGLAERYNNSWVGR